MHRPLTGLALAACLTCLASVASAQAPAPAPPAEAPKPAAPAPPRKDEQTVDYDKFVRDLKRVGDSMPIYQKGKNLFLEIPESKIGKIFLVQAALNTGLNSSFLAAGMPIGGESIDAFRFDRKDDVLTLVRPNISNRWRPDDPFKISAERAFPEAFLGSYRIEQENHEKHLLLVNITGLFFGDAFHVNEMIAGGLQGPYQLDPQRSAPESVKGFPNNTVVQMKLHYMSPRGAEVNPIMALLGMGGNNLEDDRSAPVRITYNIGWRKDSDYRPRLSDPRIGYFTDDYFSLDKFLSRDQNEHHIYRWDLRKKDPKAAMSEPVKPIVWTIDPSVPAAYHSTIKEGILRWNRAFEKLGFKDAVRVQEVPKDDTNYDHADGRYNVVRMIVGPAAPFAAISLMRSDPFTGEILNASITFDGNTLRALVEEHSRVTATALAPRRDRASQVFLRRSNASEPDDQFLFATPQEEAVATLEKRMTKYGWSHADCDYTAEKASMASLSWNALMAAPGGPGISRDAYVKEFLADCISHELGHCLGLRHNFAGSLNLSIDQLSDDKLTSDAGISASVMDYTPPNVQSILKGRGNFFMNTVGSYDMWAIKYGYSAIDAQTPIGERYALSMIARQSALPGHAFLTDEDADAFNPRAVRFDCSKDPLAFSAKQLLALRRARDWAIQNLPRPGESYADRTRVILDTISRTFREGRIAARFLGGTLGTRNFRGDPGEQPTLAPVEPTMQRQALSLVVKNFLAPDSFQLPVSVMESMSIDAEDGDWNAPLRDRIGALQSNMLALVMGAATTDRIVENSYKSNGSDQYSLEEHYGAIASSVFAEIGHDRSISALRRDLQRFTADGLIRQASAPQGAINADTRLITQQAVARLDERIKLQLARPAKLDNITKLHLKDLHDQIVRYRTRLATAR